MPSPRRGFTLIELLIVVAIIGILSLIALINFANAQIRSKIARVQADMRNIDTAIETFRLDNEEYPRTSGQPELTTPISYMAMWPQSPFDEPGFHDPKNPQWQPAGRWENRKGVAPTYLLTTGRSSRWEGPQAYNPPINIEDKDGDRRMDDIQLDMIYMVGGIFNYNKIEDVPDSVHWNIKSVGPNGRDDRPPNVVKTVTIYNPTNGLRSKGDVLRFGPGWGMPGMD